MSTEKIMKKIAALLQKTVENGCSPEEAMSAAEADERLMREYQISQSEAELGAEGIVIEEVPLNISGAIKLGKEFMIRDLFSVQLAKYCSCRTWKNKELEKLYLLGLRSDVDLLVYLLDALSVNAWKGAVANTAHIKGERRGHRRNFILGFNTALAVRIRKIVEEREADENYVTSDGKSLVLIKKALSDRAFEDLNLNLKSKQTVRSTDKEMFASGYVEGKKASLGRPVEKSSTLLLK